MGFLFLAGPGHIDGVGFSVFVTSIGEYLERPACSIGENLGSQNFCLRARKIRAILDTHKDITGYNAPVISRILPDHSEHGTFKGHEKEDVTSKVSDPLFTNLVQRNDSDKKPIIIR